MHSQVPGVEVGLGHEEFPEEDARVVGGTISG